MEKTKVYIVSVTHMWGSSPRGFFLSRKDAEFYAWNKNQERQQVEYSFGGGYYGVEEVEALSPISDEKLFAKFKKEKIERVEKSIAERQKCAEGDAKSIEDLTAELNEYKNL